MANSVTPANQVVHLDPFSGKLFDFNTVNSRVYLARSINGILSAFGTDVIVEGLIIASATIDASNVISIVINPGRAIIDQTMTEFPSPTTLTLDVTSLNDSVANSGNLIVVNLNFQYINTVFSNLTKLILRHKDPTGNTLSSPWFIQQDRVILATFSFDKTAKTVTQNNIPTINTLPHPTVTISNTSYEVYPFNNIVKNLRLLTQ